MEGIVFLMAIVSCMSAAVAAALLVPLSVERLRHSMLRVRRAGLTSASQYLGGVLMEDRQSFRTNRAASHPIMGALVERLTRRKEKRLAAIRATLPGALQMLGSSIGAGQSNRQAFSYVAANTRGPLAHEFMQAAWDLDAGRCMGEALEGLADRVQLIEVRMVCAAFAIQQRTGGNVRPILESAAASLRQSAEFQRSLHVQTTQSRLSARLVSGMPFVLLFLLASISPGYLDAFFSSSAGATLFIVALTLDAVGVFAIRRIVRIEG